MFLLIIFILQAAVAMGVQPHIVVIMVDDWGHNNVGYHARTQPNAAEVQTPVMDQLAAEGVILDRHYVFQYCSPSRSALHTGRNPIHVNVLNSPLSVANPADPVSGFAGIPRNMTALPAKLAAVGYETVQAGKWHIGLASPDHTPKGRGYAKSLTYLDGANDYWTSVTGDWCGSKQYTDLWAHDAPAFGLNNSWSCDQEHQAGCAYEDDIFANFTVAAINAHNPATPMFIYFAPHNIHMPLQVPAAQLAKFAKVATDSQPRQYYSAMVNMVDTHIGMVVDALKTRGMWDNTLLVLSADNGGPIYGGGSTCTTCNGDAGANNYPLRGGKHSNFEGGVRANAFVSGGFLPAAMRGTTTEALVGIEDWYVTLARLAGADPIDERAAAAGLPPVEGFDMWPLLSGANATSPRTEVWLGSFGNTTGDTAPTVVQGLIRADGWKLLQGPITNSIWQGLEIKKNKYLL